MKIDRSRPSHWLYLTLFGLNVLAALILRRLRPNKQHRNIVVLYGHKLNGNLLALYRYAMRQSRNGAAIEMVFLTLDPDYHRQLKREGVSCCLAIAPQCIRLLATARAIVTDHGLHAMKYLIGAPGLKFFDVWHGIPFKGFDPNDFCLQHRYDEIWIASPLLRDLYVERFGFLAERVRITGYARTDALVTAGHDPKEIRQRFGLERFASERFVLFAPTWTQDVRDRSLFPFGLGEEQFLGALARVCRSNGAVLLVRKHLNSQLSRAELDNVVHLPHAEFPDTEAILLVSDVLVCDWSSIAFDYLLLHRPTLFVDIEPPFQKGFSLGPEYRFGPIVSDMLALLDALEGALRNPSGYRARFGSRHETTSQRVYGGFADGLATSRCMQRLTEALTIALSSQ